MAPSLAGKEVPTITLAELHGNSQELENMSNPARGAGQARRLHRSSQPR